MDGSIASAVVLPEPNESPPPTSTTSGYKRRQSSASEQDEKRRRLGDDADNNTRRESDANSISGDALTERQRKTAMLNAKERTRGKRLMGGILGALSQGSSTTAQRRRADIEKKQRTKLQAQDQENDQRKKERLAKLTAQRKEEQKKFDEESMRFRHDGLLNMAHFLFTKSEPRLYYKPWELTPDEEDRIQVQVADARAIIDRELDEIEAERGEVQKRVREAIRDKGETRGADALQATDTVGNQRDAEPLHEHSATNGAANDSETTLPSNQEPPADHADGMVQEAVNVEQPADGQKQNSASNQAAPEQGGKEALDDNGEEMVEAAEDTVIY